MVPPVLPNSFRLYSKTVSSGNLIARPPMSRIMRRVAARLKIAESQASCPAAPVVSTGRVAMVTVERIMNSIKTSWRLWIFSVVIFPPFPGFLFFLFLNIRPWLLLSGLAHRFPGAQQQGAGVHPPPPGAEGKIFEAL